MFNHFDLSLILKTVIGRRNFFHYHQIYIMPIDIKTVIHKTFIRHNALFRVCNTSTNISSVQLLKPTIKKYQVMHKARVQYMQYGTMQHKSFFKRRYLI